MLKKVIRIIKDNQFAAPLLLVIDLLLLCIDIAATIGSRTTSTKKICVVKLDKLGDYILLRNFLTEVKRSPQFENCHLTLIGNSEQRMFAEFLDADQIDHFIWLDIYKYSTNPFYRFKKARQIYMEGFSLVVCPTYARVLVLDDFIVRSTQAAERIGQRAHLINIKAWERFIGDRCYTSLMQLSRDVIFEFERNRAFFSQLLGCSLARQQLNIDCKGQEASGLKDYVLVAPGAGDSFRQWKAEYFAQLADIIIQHYGYDIVLCGSPAEKSLGDTLRQFSAHPDRISNVIGSLPTPELLAAYRDARFIVSNESASVHIAAALNCLVFCISNGNHFRKYSEYPTRLRKSVYYIYPDEIDEKRYDDAALARRFDIKSTLDINSITVEKVTTQIIRRIEC